MGWDFGAEIHALTNFDADNATAYSASAGTGAISEETLLAHANQWLTDAAKDVIHALPPSLKIKCSTRASITDLNGMDLDGKGEILYITRLSADSGGYEKMVREIPPMYGDLTNDSSSLMYYATELDPVYFITNNASGNPTLFVRPNPTSAQPSYVHHVSYPTVLATEDSITNFADEAEPLVVLGAAMKALCYKMTEMHTLVPSHSDQDGTYSDPNTSAENQGWEQVRHWIDNEEDSELAGVNAQTLGAEVQQWVAEYQWYQSKHQMLQQEYQQKLAFLSGKAQASPPPPPQEKKGAK